jgi:hypothetical protein
MRTLILAATLLVGCASAPQPGVAEVSDDRPLVMLECVRREDSLGMMATRCRVESVTPETAETRRRAERLAAIISERQTRSNTPGFVEGQRFGLSFRLKPDETIDASEGDGVTGRR